MKNGILIPFDFKKICWKPSLPNDALILLQKLQGRLKFSLYAFFTILTDNKVGINMPNSEIQSLALLTAPLFTPNISKQICFESYIW